MKSVNFIEEVEAIPEEGALPNRKNSSFNGFEKPNSFYVRRSSNASTEKGQSQDTRENDAESQEAARSREEKVRAARERFEAERQRRLDLLLQAQRAAAAFREEQLQLKKKKLEEARAKHQDRRRTVEERRKQMLIEEKAKREELHRKMITVERSYESRRSISGPSGGRVFAFGSCTPREICSPIVRPPPLAEQNGQKPGRTRREQMPSRTVLSTPDVRSHRRRGSSDWEAVPVTPRARGHASLMTGSFTTAMGAPPSSLGLSSTPDPVLEEPQPLQRAASAANLNRTARSKPHRPTLSPFPNNRDALDRTVSTPNIAQSAQKSRSRTKFGGHKASDIHKRGTPDSDVGSSRRSTNRSSGSLGPSASVASLGPSSSLFDRLSQPRRLSAQAEEGPLVRPAKKAPETPKKQKPKPKPKPAKPEKPKNAEKQKPAKAPKPIIDAEDGFHIIKPAVHVVVSGGEAADVGQEVETAPEASKDEAGDGLAPQVQPEEKEEEEESKEEVPKSSRKSPPRSLNIAPSGKASGGQQSPSSGPAISDRPGGLRAPSPSPKMTKGSAPSTPTGHREFPRSPTKEISEEEYKQKLAEQRRLARERLAAQEAERLRAKEEEKKRREEEAARLREEMERLREEEETRRRLEEEEQEAKMRQEREEEERKKAEEEEKKQELIRQTRESLEQLERQRAEQHRIEEQHRLERKKRLENIMSRVKKSTDLSGSRESLSSSHLDLTANGEEDRALSPAPQFKSALLQSMLSKGRLSNSIRAVSALRRSEGQSGSTGSLIADIRNLSRSSENLVSGDNSGDASASAAGDMTTSQTEVVLSPPPVVNPAMWRSHPNGIPGLSGRDRSFHDDGDKEFSDMETSIRIPNMNSVSTESDISEKDTPDFQRQTSVRFQEVDVVQTTASDEEPWISSPTNREVADLMS